MAQASTASDGQHGSRARARRHESWVWAAGLAAFAALLAGIASPRLVASLLRVAGDGGVAAVERDFPTSAGLLDAVIDSRQAARNWVHSGRNSVEIGMAAMRLLSAMELLPVRQPQEEARYLDQAIAALQDGLARRPAQPYGWLQLAFAHLKRENVLAAERAWRMAVRTGPHEPALIVPRVAVGLVLWQDGTSRTRQMVVAEVEQAAVRQPRSLARLAARLGAEDFIREILASKPRLLILFGEMAHLPEAGSPLFP